jgi:hypothetical protein
MSIFPLPKVDRPSSAAATTVEDDPERSFFLLGGSGMIVEDIADNSTLLLGLDRIGIAMLHQCDHGLPNCPASRALPGRRIKRNS